MEAQKEAFNELIKETNEQMDILERKLKEADDEKLRLAVELETIKAEYEEMQSKAMAYILAEVMLHN